MAPFVGRRAEIEAIDDRLRWDGDQHSSVIWVEGEAGWGKTALVRHVTGRLPDGITTFWVEADELAVDVAYGVAGQLGPIGGPNPFAIGMGLLDHLSEQQSGGPIVVVVEDLHWADTPSRQALLTVARRLGPEPIVLIVTSRPRLVTDDGWARLIHDDRRCLTVRLGALTSEEVGDWARLAGFQLTDAQAERLHRHTAGHPLYVRTLLNELTTEQLTSTSSELPVPRSLAATTIAALGGVGLEAQVLAAAMAVAGGRAPLVEIARVAGIDDPTRALEALLSTGIVRWWPGEPSTPIEFTHPLYRAAIYDDLSPTRRQQLHREMATRVGRAEGWAHRVAATGGVDDRLANELDEGALDALRQGEISAATRYLLWAAPLTSSTQRAEHRLLRGARLLANAHQSDRLDELLTRILACTPCALRDLVLGIHARDRGNLGDAKRYLEAAAGPPPDDQPDDRNVRADAYAHLSALHINLGAYDAAGRAATAALDLAPDDEGITRMAWASLATSVANARGTTAGVAILRERLPGEASTVQGDDIDLLLTRAMMALHNDGRGAIDDLQASIELIRRGFGGAALAARAHVVLAEAFERTGQWSDALLHARAARELVDLGVVWYSGRPEATTGLIAAARGDVRTARQHLAIADAALEQRGSPWVKVSCKRLAAMIATVEHDPVAAVAALRPLVTDDHVSIVNVLFTTWWPPLITALIGAGRIDEAADHLAEFEARSIDLDVPTEGLVLRLRARLAAASGDAEAADELFAAGIATTNPNDFQLDHALLHHERGRVLRARKRRREATDELRLSHDALVRLGAEPFRKAVADDLAACGVRGLPISSRSTLTFTEREQDVITLARRGLTNRDIGQELYISAKAVEYHFRNVYGKLGVRTRRELLALDLPVR